MAIPTPSFFKIRLYAFLIGFVVLCFLVGAAKDVFGANPDCDYYYIPYPINTSMWANGGTFTVFSKITIDSCSGAIDMNSPVQASMSCTADVTYILRKSNGDEIAGTYRSGFGDVLCGIDIEVIGDCSEDQCGEPCEEERNAKISECGGEEYVDWSTWSDDTCSGGTCINPCDGEGEYTGQDCYDTCNGDIEVYDENSCSCVCGNCDEELAQKQQECGSWGVDYTEWNNITCSGPCNDDPCDAPIEACISQCNGQENIKNFSCQDGVVTVPCECKEPPDESDPGESEPDPSDPPPNKEPEPDKPDNPDDPNDEKLGAIHDELQKIVEQNNDRKDQLNTASNKLDWIGKNNEIIANNTDAINKNIGNLRSDIASGVEAGVSDAMEGVEDGLDELSKDIDQLTDAVEDISEGNYTAPGEEDSYASEEHDFGDRTSEFLNQMKTTGIFSLPNQLSDSIPGGGSSTYTISTGETFGGDHTIDFSYLAGGLTILKYIFQIAGMAMAIRIVTLKG